MRKEKKLAMALVSLFAETEKDEKIKKLSDRLKHRELSHNRKCLLLKQINNKIKVIKETLASESLKVVLTDIEKQIDNELQFVGRKNWGYFHKQQPGHYCED